MKVQELEGALLDYWVAMAGEEWKTAHQHYPTMTLDPTFSGVFLVERDGKKECWLKPHNPMCQDPQPFWPSVLWEHGGPIIERERIRLTPVDGDGRFDGEPVSGKRWLARVEPCLNQRGDTVLIAAMRAFVESKLGINVPDEMPDNA